MRQELTDILKSYENQQSLLQNRYVEFPMIFNESTSLIEIRARDNISQEERGGSQGTLQIRCAVIVEALVHLLWKCLLLKNMP